MGATNCSRRRHAGQGRVGGNLFLELSCRLGSRGITTLKPHPRASILLALIFIPWIPVLVYDVATRDSVEGANIGTGFFGILAIIFSIVAIVIYISRGVRK